MTKAEEIQKLIKDINFEWANDRILVSLGNGRVQEIRDAPLFVTEVSLLVEILSEVKQIKEALFQQRTERQQCKQQ